MRFVELRPTPGQESFRLHPRITWLRGLHPAARVAVVGMVHDVALGERPDWDGIVEIDGEPMSLDDGVARLGKTAESALVVDAASLFEGSSGAAPKGSLSDESYTSAQKKVEDLDVRITALAEELAGCGQVRSDMSAHLASATAGIDTESGPGLDRADGALGRAARLGGRPDPWTGAADGADRIVVLEAQIGELETILGDLPNGDRPALAAAVATARAGISDGQVASPEAMALAQAWTSLHQRLVGLESRMEAAGGGTEVVAARLDAALAAAVAAEKAAVPRPILPEEAETLETLHEEMLDAERRAGRGVRRGAGRAAFEVAAAALQEALAPLGYPTWAALRMGNGLVSVSQEVLVEHDRSQAELEAAEIELAELMARLERDTELQDVLTAIDRALDRARELLGNDPYEEADDAGPAVVTEALQSAVVDAGSIGVRREAAMAHLVNELAAAGATGHEDMTSDAATIALGESWVGVLAAADEAAVRILRDRERAAEELAALQAVGNRFDTDRFTQERDTVRAAEVDVAGTREALVEVVRARMQLYALAATELILAEEHDDRAEQREGAQVLVDVAVRRLEGQPGGGADLADRVPRGAGGPIPMVVVVGAAPADALDVLLTLPDDVQVLVIGEGDGSESWLRRVGDQVAGAVEAGSLV
jgi:hypothetical protein